MLEGQHAGHRLNTAGSTQQVAGHRFGGAHRDLQRTITQSTLDGRGLVLVVGGCAGAVGVHIIDLRWIDAAISQGQSHCFSAADTARCG